MAWQARPSLQGRRPYRVVRAWVEAALGERERAMELLQEDGYQPAMYGHDMGYRMDSMRDYPPYQEFIRPRG